MILQRYIAAGLVKGWLLVLMVLAAIFGLITFIQELDHTRFGYNAAAVGRYTLFMVPGQLVSLAPVIALLGSIVALSGLDRSNELTIISCTGFSRSRLLLAIALPTLVFMALLWLCMEYVSPLMQQSAEQRRQDLRYRGELRIPDGGVWSHNGRRYIHLDKMYRDGTPGEIDLYEFEPDGRLIRALHAFKATVNRDRSWTFQPVREKTLNGEKMETRELDQLVVPNLWARDELPTVTLASDAMTLSVLYRYSRFRADTGQPAERYLGRFWQQLLLPVTVLAMVLLAMPISANLGARRDRSFGLNIAIGALVGILFYLGAQVIFALGQLLGLNIPLIAATPAVLVLVCALVMMRRMNW